MKRSVSRFAFVLPELPYAKEALQPHISAETLSFHHGKHHAAYVKKLNELVTANDKLANKSLEELIKTQDGIVFNQAAQIWNHTFYWHCMSPNGGGAPTGAIAEKINRDFGDFVKFKEQFSSLAATHFGSGWAWLVMDESSKLKLVGGHDAMTPIRDGSGTPLLTCDVWEHAYYIDTRNDRPGYVNSWWNVVNWDFVNANLKGEKSAKM